MSRLPFSIFKQGSAEYEVVDKAARESISHIVIDNGKLKGRRFVIVTDSYGTITDNFCSRMQVMCPELVTNDNFFVFAYDGAGFVSDGTKTWQNLFVASGDIDDVTTPNTITDVFVVGGSNDRGSTISESDIATAGSTLLTSITTKFPNANVYVGYIGYSVNPTSGNYAPLVKAAYQDLGLIGYRPISEANSWLHYTLYVTDNVHPTRQGSNRIALGMLNTIIGGGSTDIFNNKLMNVPIVMASGFTSTNLNGRVYTCHFGHRSSLKIIPAAFSITSGSFHFNGDWTEIASLNGGTFLYGANDNFHVKIGSMSFQYGGKEYSIPVAFKLYNNKIYIKVTPVDSLTGSTPVSLTYVTFTFDGWEADDIFM